jgi:hypothetical protein
MPAQFVFAMHRASQSARELTFVMSTSLPFHDVPVWRGQKPEAGQASIEDGGIGGSRAGGLDDSSFRLLASIPLAQHWFEAHSTEFTPHRNIWDGGELGLGGGGMLGGSKMGGLATGKAGRSGLGGGSGSGGGGDGALGLGDDGGLGLGSGGGGVGDV